MKARIFVIALSLGHAVVIGQAPPTLPPASQTWNGVLSETKCGADHSAIAAPGKMTERECAFHCLKGLSTYVLVDDQKNIIPIANQDFAGFPLRLARPVRITGVLTEKGIVVSRIEPPLVHAHIGHVMIGWRDTPGAVGLLTVALSDARVASAHALLTSKATDNLADMKLHAGHVLHALDSAIEPKGPASGYGVRKATVGALQHVGFAAGVEGASATVKSHASTVSARLNEAMAAIDRGVATAQRIQASNSAAEAGGAVADLVAAVEAAGGGLQQAEQEMRLMMKAEGL
jgi:hypothetical protein